MSSVVYSEHRGTFSKVKLYKSQDLNVKLQVLEEHENNDADNKHTKQSNYSQSLLLTFRQIFLPHGFPESVSNDYVEYQIYDTIQAFSSSITGALATEAVMRGVGVGSSEATPLAAAMTWLLKSGSGMVGQILFTWSKGTALDYDNKKWRLFADVLNDTATFIDLVTPLFPSSIIIFVFCLSSIARALVGVAGGATRAAITQHQARKNNSADVSAKDGSQETLVNLVSLIVCLILLPLVSGRYIIVWSLFFLFTFLHIFGNYRALRALNLECFNTSRLLIALQQYLSTGHIPSVQQTNQRESLVVGFGIKDTHVCGFRVKLGVSLESALSSLNTSQLQFYIDNSEGKPFIIIPDIKAKALNILLSERLTSVDLLEAYGRSIIAAYSFTSKQNETKSLNLFSAEVTEDWEIFLNSAIAGGYSIAAALLDTGDWRAKWKQHI